MRAWPGRSSSEQLRPGSLEDGQAIDRPPLNHRHDRPDKASHPIVEADGPWCRPGWYSRKSEARIMARMLPAGDGKEGPRLLPQKPFDDGGGDAATAPGPGDDD